MPTTILEINDLEKNYGSNEILKGIDLQLLPGKITGLLGRNGAGKTTIVKLLCNFYKPSNGRILIDGMSLDEYNRDALWKTFSVVFQDVHIMPLTIAENIALTPLAEIDAEKLDRAIYLSDLKEKIDLLPNREKTLL